MATDINHLKPSINVGKKALYRYFYCLSIALSGALAVITIIGGQSGTVLPETSEFYPFVGLALPVLLLANAVVGIYWIIRLRCWWLIPFAAFVFNWSYLSCVIRFSIDTPATPSKTLTLATYNVDSFNDEGMGYSCRSIAQYMSDHKVDVFCMQEFGTNKFFTVDSVVNVLSQWPYYYIPKDSLPLLQLAVFSKYPITDRQLITYDDSRNCSLWCDIDVDGKTIRVFNNHLQTTEVTRNKNKLEKELGPGDFDPDRAEAAAYQLMDGMHRNFILRSHQAQTLHRMTESTPHPMLVCGDFNSIPSSYTYHTVKGDKLLDGFQSAGHGYMYTFHYLKRLLRIDYIFHSPELKAVDYFSDDLEYSDHNPVLMTVGW